MVEDEESNLLTQYVVRCSQVDKFLLMYVSLKLRLIAGKILVFVNSIDRCYRLKLFLEQFSIKACVLNSELPLNSRYDIVQEFNRGVYDIIIATDESNVKNELSTLEEAEEEEAPKKRKLSAIDREYGSSRGVDFQDVNCVVNFDFPMSAKAYQHCIGRTARAGKAGVSLSFVVPSDKDGIEDKKERTAKKKRGHQEDEVIFKKVEEQQKTAGNKIMPYEIDMEQVEGFRYRMEDALSAVSKGAVKEARVTELKQQIINSEKLKAHFEDRPRDLAFLKHDKVLRPSKVEPHMKNVPKYLLPNSYLPRIASEGVPNTRRGGRGGKKRQYVPPKVIFIANSQRRVDPLK